MTTYCAIFQSTIMSHNYLNIRQLYFFLMSIFLNLVPARFSLESHVSIVKVLSY